MKSKTFLAFLLMFCIVLPAQAQNKPAVQPPPQQASDDKDDVVKITTNLVQVDAVVTKDGKPVSNLTADDFEIFEDGRRQTITSFAYISNVSNSTPQPEAPAKKTPDVIPYRPLQPNEARRIVAFVVDDLGLSFESMYQVRRQLRKFITEKLEPNDLVAIIRTSGQLGALQQFTNDKRLLTRAVERLRWTICSRVGINVMPAAGGLGGGGGICGFRSLNSTFNSLRFILDAMGHLPGRKSLVLLSDHVPRESQDELFIGQESLSSGGDIDKSDSSNAGADSIAAPDSIDYSSALRKIAEKAIRSSVVIYSVDTQGLVYTGLTAADSFRGSGPQLQSLMASRSRMLWSRREGSDLIARQTGGFQIRNSNSFQFERIMEDQSGYYLLGYRPSDETFNRRFHHIKAKVKRSGLSLRTRYGFYGVSEEEAKRAQPSVRDTTNLALASPFGAQDIEVDLTAFFADDNANRPVIRSFVYLDPKNLTFTSVDGRHQASIEVHSVIFGDNGIVVEQLAQGASLNLTEEAYQHAMRYGLGMGFDMPVKRPGDYQVRVAARDRTSSRIGSAGQFVVVPDLKKQQLAASGVVLANSGADQSFVNPGTRQFTQGSDLFFAYNLYNATDKTGKLRNLVMEVMLFRDGKNVQTRPEVPIVAGNPTDLRRVYVKGAFPLTELEPGYYYLQIVVRDKDAKEKAPAVVQWADFEIEGTNTKN